MGSPYQTCRLTLEGEWTPELEAGSWVGVQASSRGGERLALAEWDLDQGVGFRIVVVDSRSQSVEQSAGIQGCCVALGWLATRWAGGRARRANFRRDLAALE